MMNSTLGAMDAAALGENDVANRLQDETSPYLLQHADNPVDWRPWGEEALRAAQETDKPIFLSVGYAACHWCHVMAHESFEDPQIAEIMNESFVNIKVDREERPDIDTIYMDAVVAMNGQGGWPLSVFLTPQAEPFYGGTYFPPAPRYNMPSFREVLLHVARLWQKNREQIEQTGAQLREHVASHFSFRAAAEALNPESFERASGILFKTYDWTNGGWGGAPKFPQASVIEFLLRKHHRDGDGLALEMAVHALDHMARGGIFDQLAGGFHRYSVDAQWRVPHFEKMLYDNALLVQAYLHAWLVCGKPLFRTVVEMTLDFLHREMRHAEGGFYASLDADSEGVEGKYYLWSEAEIGAVLKGEENALFPAAYGVSEEGNFEGKNVLHRAETLEDISKRSGMFSEDVSRILDSAREKLLRIRAGRIPPAADDKVVTAWNGLLLTSYAEAARALSRPDYLETARSLADFLVGSMLEEGKLMRTWRGGLARHGAYLEDHAAFAEGLLSLYQADFDPRWYRAAVVQAGEILANFADSAGGFFDTRQDHETLIARPKSLQDSPIPSGSTMAVSLLLKLASFSGENRYRDAAETALLAMQDAAQRYPASFSGWLSNLDYAIGPQMQIAVVGATSAERFRELTGVLDRLFLPKLVIAGGEAAEKDSPRLLEGRTMLDDLPTAYVCQQFTCKRPTASPDELGELIQETLTYDGE
jgi:uncharacterized protein YyaL (SSP411 family)